MDKYIFAFLNFICLCSCVVGLPATRSLKSLSVKNCGTSILPPRSPDRIVGGDIVPHGQYPWIISLQEDRWSGYRHVCGAAILNENWIITAAHCIDLVNEPEKYQILAGLHKLTENEAPTVQSIKISKLVVHKDFNFATKAHDIALLKTARPIDIAGSRGYVNGICLPETDRDPDGFATVIGWGDTYTHERDDENTLRDVVVPIVQRDVCSRYYDKLENVVGTMICAGVTGKDSCQNDSGGPLFQTNSKGESTLIGVVSFGRGCGAENFPGVYTKVSAYQSWIENTIASY